MRGIEIDRVEADFSGVRPSAVLVVVADDSDGNAGVLLTRRSTELRHHAGQISFPGGRIDPGETEVDAALREALEEVGLDPAVVEVVGELDHLATVVSRSHIVPVVATVATQLDLAPASSEVERVLWVPLAEFVRRTRSAPSAGACRGPSRAGSSTSSSSTTRPCGVPRRTCSSTCCAGSAADELLQQPPGVDDVTLLRRP